MITSINPQIFGGHTWKVLHTQQRFMKGPVPVLEEKTKVLSDFQKIDFRAYSFCGHGQFFQQPQLYSQEIVGYFATFARDFMHTPTKGRKENLKCCRCTCIRVIRRYITGSVQNFRRQLLLVHGANG